MTAAIMRIAAYLLSFMCLILNASLFIHLKPPYSFYLAFSFQLVAAVLSPFLAVLGLLAAGLGCFWLTQWWSGEWGAFSKRIWRPSFRSFVSLRRQPSVRYYWPFS